MHFKDNHKLHLIITMAVMMVFFFTFMCYEYNIQQITRDTNRLASAKLIINALENYYENFGVYPERLEAITDFLSPIPSDPQTQEIFSYSTKGGEEYLLIIPQEKGEEIEIKKAGH